jgi:hypothetical protein
MGDDQSGDIRLVFNDGDPVFEWVPERVHHFSRLL